MFEKWFPGLERSGTRVKHGKPRLRVLCFTPAGSSEDMYTNEGIGKRRQESPLLAWCRANNAEVFALQLPGRGRRDKEPFIKSGTGDISKCITFHLATFRLAQARHERRLRREYLKSDST